MLDSRNISLLFLSEIIYRNLAMKYPMLFEPSEHHTEETLAKTTLANGRIVRFISAKNLPFDILTESQLAPLFPLRGDVKHQKFCQESLYGKSISSFTVTFPPTHLESV